MEIIEDEILDIEDIQNKDTLTEKDVKNITGENLFLALIEPKKFATQEVIDFCKNNLTKENIKEILNSSLEEMKKQDLNSYFNALEDIEKRGIENVIAELQLEYFERLEKYKENREIVTSSSLAFLALINNKLYDFIDSSYIDLNEYYINYAEPFNKYFENKDWDFTFFKKQNLIKISFNEEIDFIIDLFWGENIDKIDENAKNKIMKIK